MLAAGVLHLVQAPMHLDHSWEHAAALATVGLVEGAWSLAWGSRRTAVTVWVGWSITIAALTLYGLSRVLPLPFEGEPEAIDAIGAATQLCEAAACLALIAFSAAARPGLRATLRQLSLVAAAAMAAGMASFTAPSIPAGIVTGG